MKNHRTIELYKQFYSDISFDRAELFQEVKNKYYCNTVMYPGSSIHITPSFYFQHVVFVDISDLAKEYFNDTEGILNLVNSNKKYKQSPYINFLDNDYTAQLPLRENTYDLLIALYAEGIIQSCKKYVRLGGIILTNNYHNDAAEALKDPSIVLDAVIQKKGKKYIVTKNDNENLIKALQGSKVPTKSIRNSNKGIEYVDNENYFVLKKIK